MVKKLIKTFFHQVGLDLKKYDHSIEKYISLYKKYSDYTMIQKDLFILNLELCHAFREVHGDFVECGVWRGGMSGAIAEVLGEKRFVHLFDSFEGLPPAKDIDGKEALHWQQDITAPGYFENCKANEAFAIQAMQLAAHKEFRIHKGWFNETLPGSIKRPIAVLRLDGDWYDSITSCLENLYPLVVDKGIIILDDYYTWDGCSRAVHDYLSSIKSASRVYQWRDQLAYIVKKDEQ